MNLFTVISSAAVASVVSGLMLLANGYFERKARRKETLVNLAFDLAKERTHLITKLADNLGGTADLRDNIFLAEDYYKWLKHFDAKGTLPPEAYKAERRHDQPSEGGKP